MTFTPSRPGQALGTGDANAKFIEKYALEVIAAMEYASKTMDKHTVKTIENGKSYDFPVTGLAKAGRHTTPGVRVAGTVIKSTSVKVEIDDMLYSASFIDKLDEAKVHWDVRKVYSDAQGQVLAAEWDKMVLRTGILAARSAANIPGETAPGSIVYGGTGLPTTASALKDSIFSAAVQIETNKLDLENSFLYIKPAQHSLLVKDTVALNRDWAGSGSYERGTLPMVAGLALVKCPQLPSTNLSGNDAAITAAGEDPAIILAKYRGDYSATTGVVIHRSAVGTLKLLDLEYNLDRIADAFGYFSAATLAIGVGKLKPEGCVELRAAASP